MRFNNPTMGFLMGLDSYKMTDAIQLNAMRREKAGIETVDEKGDYLPEVATQAFERDAEDILEIVSAFQTGKLAGESVKIKDLLMTKDYPRLFYAATEILMRNRIAPQRVVSSNLFQTVPYSGSGLNVTIRTMGGVQIEEVPEGGEYPETSSAVTDQAFRINLEIKKFGAKVAATKELMESDHWGILAFTLASLADELLNKKEARCVTMLNELAGYTLLDNANAASVALGSTTGRGIDGNQNGSMSIDDFFQILAWMQMRGYNVDTLLIHPFAWAMWARDPEVREVLLDGNVSYTPNGNAAPGWPSPWGGLGQPTGAFGSSIAQVTPANAQTGAFNSVDPIFGKLGVATYAFPNLTPFGANFSLTPRFLDRPLKILVSPFVPYYKISGGSKAGKYATNIIFADSSKTGLILQAENPTMEEWTNIEREINFVKIKERYGMALQEQGRSVAVARNIVVDRSYAFDNVNSVALSPLVTTGNLV